MCFKWNGTFYIVLTVPYFNFMKKFFVLLALVCTVLNVTAQEDSKWSIKVDAGLSSIVGSDSEGNKSAFSYKVGVGYDFGISEHFAIEPALMLTNKSHKEDLVDGTINRYYVELPIMAAFKIALSDETKLIINAGPYAAYGLYGSDIDWYDGGTDNVFDLFERFEAGAQVGAKVAFGSLEIGAEYSRALTKIVSDYKGYSQTIGLTFGYRF